ncbi:MAG: hypothetical protein IT305_21845 [Chloroflexi bacterium]|nr:hypothetical protein [Chloroflexota bacterium]
MAEFLERAQPWLATLVSHNWPVLVYALAAVWAAWRAFSHPSRHAVLFLYGALLLVFAYEYQKHALPTIAGTTSYLFSLEANSRLRSASQWLLMTALPILVRLLGIGMLGLAILIQRRETHRRRHPTRSLIVEL